MSSAAAKQRATVARQGREDGFQRPTAAGNRMIELKALEKSSLEESAKIAEAEALDSMTF